MPETPKITIGETVYHIAPFTPRKGLAALELFSRAADVAQEVTSLVSAYAQEYREQNRQVITRAMAGVPPYSDQAFLQEMTDADWERVGGRLEIRPDPSEREIVMRVLPTAFMKAKREIVQVFGLIVIPNQEASKAEKEGCLWDVLYEKGNEVVDASDEMEPFIDLIEQTIEVIKAEMGKASGLGPKLREAWAWIQKMRGLDLTTEAEAPESASSTDSPVPTTGVPTPASTT